MKRRSTIIALVILLAVGFATVSTTLVLNGVIGLGESDDFKIIFTKAKLDGVEKNEVIGTDKTTINYETKTLTTVDEESELVYEATNTSRNYDAEVNIECNIVDNEGNKVEGNNIYVDMTYEPNSMLLSSGETKSGKVHARLIKAVTEPMDISCSNLTTIDLSNFDTSKVTRMNSMFSYCNQLTNLDLSNFDTSNVTNMSMMFYCSNLTTIDLSNVDASIITNEKIFSEMPNAITIKVKDKAAQDALLAHPDKKSTWTTENIVIKEA